MQLRRGADFSRTELTHQPAFNLDWDSRTSQRWESALMTRQDFEAPMVVESEQKRLVTDA